MNFQLTITGDNVEDMFSVIQTLNNGKGNTTTIVSRPVKTPKKTETPKPEEASPENNSEEAGDEHQSVEAGSEEITVEEVRKAVQQKINGNATMKEKVKNLLKNMEAESVTVLPDTKYSEFLQKLKAL